MIYQLTVTSSPCKRRALNDKETHFIYRIVKIRLKVIHKVMTMIIMTDTMTKASGNTENVASPLLIWLLADMKRIPETRIIIPARRKQKRLR